jgi:hypothetical protein
LWSDQWKIGRRDRQGGARGREAANHRVEAMKPKVIDGWMDPEKAKTCGWGRSLKARGGNGQVRHVSEEVCDGGLAYGRASRE